MSLRIACLLTLPLLARVSHPLPTQHTLSLSWHAPVLQDPAPTKDFDTEYRRGITAVSEGRHAEAVEIFKSCLELDPVHASCAYNIACAHALLGARDEAFAWLERAARMGFGNVDGSIAHAKEDPDLEGLRGDERYAKFLATLDEVQAERDRYVGQVATYVPESLKDAEKLPLVVCLHGFGGTRDDMVSGPWKAAADKLGFAILAPSGSKLRRFLPEQGMSWYMDAQDFARRPWTYATTVDEALKAFREEHELDPERIFIAGLDQGGVLAFDIGIAAPGLYRGAFVLDGPILEIQVPAKAPNAAKLGFRYVVRQNTSEVFGLPENISLPEYSKGLAERLSQTGLVGSCDTYELEGDDRAKRITSALRELIHPPTNRLVPEDAEPPADEEL